jgi:ABC transport system ATP-binding/permease protein
LKAQGIINEFVGGYSDWLAYCAQQQKEQSVKKNESTEKKTKPEPAKKKKLSYKDQKELETLPETISRLEAEQANLSLKISAADFYKNDQALIAKTLDDLKGIEAQLEQAYSRWDELETFAVE